MGGLVDEFEKLPIAVNHFGVVVVQGVEVFVDRVCWKLVLNAQFEVKVGCCTLLQDQVWFGIWHGVLCDVPHPTCPRFPWQIWRSNPGEGMERIG